MEVPSNFRKTLIKPLYKKGDKSECGIYRGISLVSVGSKFLSIIILFRQRDAIDKLLNKNSVVLKKVEEISTEFSLLGQYLRSA